MGARARRWTCRSARTPSSSPASSRPRSTPTPTTDWRSRTLLERWNLGLGSSVAERRIALRLSREAVLLDEREKQGEVATLPSVSRVLATASPPEDEAQ